MQVDPEKAAGITKYAGHAYYFCGVGCKKKFDANPTQYLTKKSSALVQLGMPVAPARIPAPQAGVEYTCPMHPEVRQIGPGTCPKCGMALEPLEVTGEADQSEIR